MKPTRKQKNTFLKTWSLDVYKNCISKDFFPFSFFFFIVIYPYTKLINYIFCPLSLNSYHPFVDFH